MGAQPLTYEEVLKLIKQLPDEDQKRLADLLARQRLIETMERLRKEIPETEITEEEIQAEVDIVRQQMYEERQRRNNP